MMQSEFVLVAPRVLADDLLLHTAALQEELPEGDVAQQHEEASQATFAYFQALGARISAGKCCTFANTASLRARLKRFTPPGHQQPIRVACSARDLGAHLNVGKRASGSTLTKRLGEAAKTAELVARFPASFERRMQVVLGKVLPQGLYGVEATPASSHALRHLRTKIATVVDGKAAPVRAVELALAVALPRRLTP
eukprot:7064341-Alexandrium_andersonii.AAC.1